MLNRKLKNNAILNAYIHLIIVLIRVRDIKNDVHETKKYVVHEIYFLEHQNENENIVITKIIL